MLKYTISILFFIISLSLYAQDVTNDTITTNPTQKFGLRIGTDLYRATKPLYNKGYTGFELSADYRITQSHYLALELGTEKNNVNDNLLNFTTQGSYAKIGFDYNAYENWLDMQNMIYVGLRYGYSNFNQTLHSYGIYNTNNYFPAYTVTSNTAYSSLNAHWAEFVAGIKVEILNNLYLGFSLRLKRLIQQKKPTNFDNLYIPGFNRTADGQYGAGFNYTISYLIPFIKK